MSLSLVGSMVKTSMETISGTSLPKVILSLTIMLVHPALVLFRNALKFECLDSFGLSVQCIFQRAIV